MSESVQDLSDGSKQLAPRTGTSFVLKKGQRLTVVDPKGEQVADLLAFNANDTREVFSNGRTIYYNGTINFTTGHKIYSNRSNAMLHIVDDTIGKHDFLLTPCSKDTFRILFGDNDPPPGCFGNLAFVLERHGIAADSIPVPFNCFMNVPVDGATGNIKIVPPTTKAGDHIDFVAEMDLIVGLTACSSPRTNGGSFKPIVYRIS